MNKILTKIGAEKANMDDINDCFIYLRAISESAQRGQQSELFGVVPQFPVVTPSQDMLYLIGDCMRRFVEECSTHPNVSVALVILSEIYGVKLKGYFQENLNLYYHQGDVRVCYELCCIREDLGERIWIDACGNFILSRSCNDAETNLQVAKRYIETTKR